jgi:ribosomal protein S18 acetylase RimI-like enzyme
LKMNPARRLYERLGFGVEEEREYFFHMRYSPGPRFNAHVP